MPHFGDFQNEIYGAGLRGVVPRLPVDFAALELRARAAMPASVLAYVQGGCGDEFTQRYNADAFQHWGLVPRMMVDCTTRDLSVELFGLKLAAPIFLSPIGVLGICTPDGHGDLHAARAAARTGVPMVASTLSNDPLEAVAEALEETPGFFQLYTPKDKQLAESLVHRAEAAGYKALVVTLDTWLTGWRPRDLNTANFPQLRGHVLANYTSDPRFRAMLTRPPEEDMAAAVGLWAQTFGKVLTWADMPWLRSLTSCRSSSKASAIPTTRGAPSTPAPTASTARTTVGARPTEASRPSTCCPRSSRHAAARLYCSTPAYAPAATSSKRSPWEPPRSASAGLTPMGSRSKAQPASSTCSEACLPKPTSSWPLTASPPSPLCGRRASSAFDRRSHRGAPASRKRH